MLFGFLWILFLDGFILFFGYYGYAIIRRKATRGRRRSHLKEPKGVSELSIALTTGRIVSCCQGFCGVFVRGGYLKCLHARRGGL
jgi:hypothetical protein